MKLLSVTVLMSRCRLAHKVVPAKLKNSVLLERLCLRLRAQDQVAALLLDEQELLVDLKMRQEVVVSTVLDSSLSIFVLRLSSMAAPLSLAVQQMA